MPTKEELQKQLATIEAGLLDFSTVGEAAYLKKTGEQKLTTKAIPRYTDVYNAEFEKVKNVQFNIGANKQTLNTKDKALYIANPTVEAERITKSRIQDIEAYNKRVEEQKSNINTFLASEKEVAKQTVLQNYLSSVLNPQLMYGQLNPFEYETIDVTTVEGQTRWRNAANNMKTIQSIYDQQGRRTQLYNHVIKLTPAQIAEKKKTTEAIERVRFMSSPTLQKTYAEKYRQQLLAQIKAMK